MKDIYITIYSSKHTLTFHIFKLHLFYHGKSMQIYMLWVLRIGLQLLDLVAGAFTTEPSH